MSKNLEYVIMIFLAGMLIIMFRWSENNHYIIYSGDRGEEYLINTRNGDTWFINNDEMIYVVELVGFSSTYKKPISGLPDPRIFADDDIKKDIRKKRMGIK